MRSMCMRQAATPCSTMLHHAGRREGDVKMNASQPWQGQPHLMSSSMLVPEDADSLAMACGAAVTATVLALRCK